MGDDGTILGMSHIVQDITDRKQIGENLEQLQRFDTLLADLSTAFINIPTNEVDKAIESWLQRIVKFLGADRCNLNRFSKQENEFRVIHSWAVEGIEPVPRYFGSKQFPWVTDKILKGNIVQFSKLEELPDEAIVDKKSYLKIGTKSHISIPLNVGKSIVGTISLASARTPRTWPEGLVKRFCRVGEVFANVLLRKQTEVELKNAFSEIKQLKDRLQNDNIYFREEIKLEHNYEEIIGQGTALKNVLFKIEQVANTDVTVLILGETGTGKELVARAIHNTSTRRCRPLMKVNCPTLPSTLIESELFGYEKGAFTGAASKHIGRFELANGATIFFDEIGDLPLEVQSKLLRVLQDGEFERLGSPYTIKTNVRIIAATNRNLEEETRNARFRKDLWYRLNVYPITVPPLRERNEDIPRLVEFFISKFSKKLGRNIKGIHQKHLKSLQEYSWPGNVRELESVIERAVINTHGAVLNLADQLMRPEALDLAETNGKSLDEIQRDYIVHILQKTNWKIEGKKGAAEILDINPNTLRGRMRKLGVKRL